MECKSLLLNILKILLLYALFLSTRIYDANHPPKVDVPRTPGSPTSTNAINLYDSGWVIDKVLFKNYDTNSTHSVFRTTGAASFFSSTRVYNVTRENSADIIH